MENLLCPVHRRRSASAAMQEEWGLNAGTPPPVVIGVRERGAEIWCSPVYRRRPASVDWMKSRIPTAVIGAFAGKAPLGALAARPLCGGGPGSPDFARLRRFTPEPNPGVRRPAIDVPGIERRHLARRRRRLGPREQASRVFCRFEPDRLVGFEVDGGNRGWLRPATRPEGCPPMPSSSKRSDRPPSEHLQNSSHGNRLFEIRTQPPVLRPHRSMIAGGPSLAVVRAPGGPC